ncbi:MAG: cytochrome d ubiquinol oxidase subunit II [Alphaproteobacteria bacterium]|nr:cytochrome d ubiquinol oxidase subunit II [Alphaproteobacteria bacterium]
MIHDLISSGDWLPVTFAFLMGLSMLIYAVLDGYDLGVGMLTAFASDDEKDSMIASIGPFWDANETWLVLGVGLLLVAFPLAHGVILSELYLPVALMLFGLIFRGVSFDFRAKVAKHKKHRWDKSFFAGSLITALAQGYMLGAYITGFADGWAVVLFSCLIAIAVASGYCLIGAAWLIWRCEHDLQIKAVRWMKQNLAFTCVGIALVSASTPFVSARIFEKWFEFPAFLMLAPIPALTGALIIGLYLMLRKMPLNKDRLAWAPFAMTIAVYVLCFCGLAYSFYPYIVPNALTIVDAASAPESLMIILIGTLIVLPILIGYTLLAYYIFRGKAQELRYD